MKELYALVIVNSNENCSVRIFESEREARYEMNDEIDCMAEQVLADMEYNPTIKIENANHKRFIYAEDPIVYWEHHNKTEPEEDNYYVVKVS